MKLFILEKQRILKKEFLHTLESQFKDRKTSQIKFLTDKVETFTTKNEVEALVA